MDQRVVRQPRGLPLPYVHPGRAQVDQQLHRHHVRRRRAEPRHRLQGGAGRARHVGHRGDEVHLEGRRRLHVRSSIVATENARDAAASVSCQSLMLDDISRSDTIPAMDIRCKHVDIGHEATIGRIGDDKVFYLMSRGVSEEEARTMIVNGFADPVSKELPLEYAVEMNNLIKLEMEGAIG